MTVPADPWGDTDDATRTVVLSLPAQPELWSLARMTASGIASKLDFDVEEIEDLRLAIDELCGSCANGNGSGRIELNYRWDDRSIEVVCRVEAMPVPRGESLAVHAVKPLGERGSPAGELSVDELSARLLDALVDEHGVEPVEGNRRRGWLRKRRARADA
jgi:anti-sigma regulatory factor (Ser/Thr protein kinase)